MSWDSYIETTLLNSGNVSKAAIIGLDGLTWAASTGFTVTPQEGADASASFCDSDGCVGHGLHFNGQKYFVLSADSESIHGKQGQMGVFLYKTEKAIIVSVYEPPIQPGSCNKTTGALADYLKNIGY